jgi:hypothetical protein
MRILYGNFKQRKFITHVIIIIRAILMLAPHSSFSHVAQLSATREEKKTQKADFFWEILNAI